MKPLRIYRYTGVKNCLSTTLSLLTLMLLCLHYSRYMHTDTDAATVKMPYFSKRVKRSEHVLFPLFENVTTEQIIPYSEQLPLLRDILKRGINEQQASKTISLTATDTITDYLEINEMRDLRQAANPNTSKVVLFGNMKQFRIGDNVRVKIELYDGWGRQLLTGGDVLRVWMVDLESKANSTGHVIDHGNGTYTGVVKALWTGQPIIKVSIANTKEHVGIVLNHIKRRGVLYYLSGIFDNGNVSEHTNCTTIPRIDGFKDVCNLTSENFGMAWYCGKPRYKRELTCKDWKFQSGNRKLNLSNIVYYLLKWHKHMNILQTLRIQVTGGYKAVPSKDLLCNKRPKKTTWHDKVPTGYFYQNQWRVLECTYPFEATKDKYMECLKGRPLIFLGDSTIRYWFVHLTEFLNLKFTLGRWDEIKDKAWQRFAYAERTDLNVSICWAPHELPFYGYLTHTKNLRSVGARLDEIGSNSRAIVVLHWYLHISRSSHKNYREHIRDARRAVDRLLNRSPGVEVLIKGPHALTYPICLEPLDYIRRYEEQILYEEFRGLQDRVTYLDEWDMTVANENVNGHPDKETNLKMIHNLLSHVCFR